MKTHLFHCQMTNSLNPFSFSLCNIFRPYKVLICEVCVGNDVVSETFFQTVILRYIGGGSSKFCFIKKKTSSVKWKIECKSCSSAVQCSALWQLVFAGLISVNLNTTFKMLFTGNVFAVPTTSSAGLIGSDVISQNWLVEQPVWRHDLLWRQSWLMFSFPPPGLGRIDEVVPDWVKIQSYDVTVNCDITLDILLANSENYIRAYKT